MTDHILKTDPAVFQAVVSGEKTWEIRYNDRDYQVGDILHLKETAYTGAEMNAGKPLIYTGNSLIVDVIYIFKGPLYGLADKWVIMTVVPIDKEGTE
jgi:hypothetical protein